MEFKYRAIDVPSPAYMSNSYFTRQPLRGVVQDHTDSYAIPRELEKEKIREGINSTETESLKRMLEMEVGREMTLPRGNGFPLHSDPLVMQFGSGLPVLPPYGGRFLEGRLTSFFPGRLAYQRSRGIGDFDHFPFQQNLEPGVPAFASNSDVFGKRGSFQAKPEETVSGAKRKAVTPPSMVGGPVKGSTIGLFAKKSSCVSKLKQDAQIVVDSEKKNGHSSEQTPKTGNPNQKQKFFCKMCNVSTDTLKVLNRHKRGKKHLRKLLKLAGNSAKKN